MTTLASQYIKELRKSLRAIVDFPALIEDSPVRAFNRDTQALCLTLGPEKVTSASHPMVTRQRELHVQVHTSGNDHLDISEAIFQSAHPLIMRFDSSGVVQVDELQTDEPRYANGDLTRQVVTRRYLITYQTLEDSLSN